MLPNRPPQWVGRENELAVLRVAMAAFGSGGGAVVWVEGEPGIGKSSLVTEALAVAGQPGWDVGWASADQLTRLPLRVMQDCLQVRSSSPDPRRAHAASQLRDRPADGDALLNGIEVLLTLVDGLCAAAPTVLVLDDLQWADEASLAVWHELAASISQLRLLLIGTCRPTPRTPQLQQVRASVVRRGGQVVTLGPLPETDVTALVTAIVGASPGDGLRRVTAQAAGNPLYVRELVDALLREQAVRISPVAEVAPAGEWRPVSLAAVLDDRLSSVSAETAQLLRTAALLGGRFAVTDLAVVLRRPVSDLAVSLQEAVAAGIVDGSGAELAFRHPLIRQALYESMPEALRTALHAEAARELAAAGADALSVAQQLSAARRRGEGWARAWLIQAVPTLTTRAPQLAVELLRGELQETPVGDEAWDALLIAVRREQRTMAGRHLREGLALPIETLTDRENRDFLVAAHALSLEQSGETRQAMLRLAEIFPRRDDEMTLIHQWLPDLVRLALAAGDRPMAQAAAKACEQEAAAGSRAARAAAASLPCACRTGGPG